ncbi:alpha/beta fold hydrolase [Actinomycetospora sp. CA-053990]|uniref:alpha/beta fold hydrolase n=1 Tax=Actinomycetospora sp. CA-053990 TaxID=3239891 RepID=UPI003D8CD850
MIDGFRRVTTTVDGAEVVAHVGGDGPALLLLHGFPQTHEVWRHVAPELARTHTVICPDLPGYGDSAVPESLAKRTTARTLLEVARRLGHKRVAVVGHDRGALVALRAALDHPEAVTHLAVLDVLPTVETWDALHGTAGVFAFHLFLLAHPTPLPETMIGADPDGFFGHFLDAWTVVPDAIPPEVRERYLAACRRPETVRAICEDYRAGATVDVDHDRADRERGRRVAAPTLALWQDPGDAVLPFDPGEVWSRWAGTLSTATLRTGHFLPEEAPADVVAHLRRHLGG